jgi:hypothetical protein
MLCGVSDEAARYPSTNSQTRCTGRDIAILLGPTLGRFEGGLQSACLVSLADASGRAASAHVRREQFASLAAIRGESRRGVSSPVLYDARGVNGR